MLATPFLLINPYTSMLLIKAYFHSMYPLSCHSITDKQNALRRECTFKIEIVLEKGMAGVNIDLNITVLTLSDVLARLAQSVRTW